jgi:hypothetical protein
LTSSAQSQSSILYPYYPNFRLLFGGHAVS